MAVIYPHFLHTILRVHESIRDQIPYPFFDNTCIRYEALRSAWVEGASIQTVIEKYGLTDYAYRKGVSAFQQHGAAGLIGRNYSAPSIPEVLANSHAKKGIP